MGDLLQNPQMDEAKFWPAMNAEELALLEASILTNNWFFRTKTMTREELLKEYPNG